MKSVSEPVDSVAQSYFPYDSCIHITYGSKSSTKIHFSIECCVHHLSSFFWISAYVGRMVARPVSQISMGKKCPPGSRREL